MATRRSRNPAAGGGGGGRDEMAGLTLLQQGGEEDLTISNSTSAVNNHDDESENAEELAGVESAQIEGSSSSSLATRLSSLGVSSVVSSAAAVKGKGTVQLFLSSAVTGKRKREIVREGGLLDLSPPLPLRRSHTTCADRASASAVPPSSSEVVKTPAQRPPSHYISGVELRSLLGEGSAGANISTGRGLRSRSRSGVWSAGSSVPIGEGVRGRVLSTLDKGKEKEKVEGVEGESAVEQEQDVEEGGKTATAAAGGKSLKLVVKGQARKVARIGKDDGEEGGSSQILDSAKDTRKTTITQNDSREDLPRWQGSSKVVSVKGSLGKQSHTRERSHTREEEEASTQVGGNLPAESTTRGGIRLRIKSGLLKKSVEVVKEPATEAEIVGSEKREIPNINPSSSYRRSGSQRSQSRRSSEVQVEYLDHIRSSAHSKAENEAHYQTIEKGQPEFARPAKRKSDTFDNEELDSRSRAQPVAFHHPVELALDQPSLELRKRGKWKSEAEYLLEAQVGTPFQLLVGFEESGGRSLRYTPKPVVVGVKGVAGGILEAETERKAIVQRSKTTVLRAKSRVAFDSDSVIAESVPVESAVTQAKKAPLKRSVSTRKKALSLSEVGAVPLFSAPELVANEESVVVEAPKQKATVSRTKSRVVFSRSKVGTNSQLEPQSIAPHQAIAEDSIEVEPLTAKAHFSRAKSRVGLSRSQVVPNLLGKPKNAAKDQEDTINVKQSIGVQGLKAKAPTSRTKSRVVSSQSKTSQINQVEGESVLQKANIVAKHKLTSSEAAITPRLPLESKSPVPQPENPTKQLSSKDSDFPPKAICITTFLKDADIKQIMPDLDESVLTRARRRAEGPRGDRLISRRRSSSHKITGPQRVNIVSETRAVSAVAEVPSATLKPSSPNYIQVDTTKPHVDLLSKPGENSSKETSKSKSKSKDRPLERNIDNVIFGDVTFKAWYPSWYPKEIIGEKGLNGDCKGIVVPDLYVCKKCFGYAKTVVDWVRHTRCCEKEIPGEKIYTHGPEGIWSIWEVDGDVDTVSLSLPTHIIYSLGETNDM